MIEREPETPQTEASHALAMALAESGYSDNDWNEQYRLIDTLPVIAALAERGYVIAKREAAALAAPGAASPELFGRRLWDELHRFDADAIRTGRCALGRHQAGRVRDVIAIVVAATPDPGPEPPHG